MGRGAGAGRDGSEEQAGVDPFEAAPVGLARLDATGRICAINRRGTALLGLKAGALLRDAIAPDDRAAADALLAGGPDCDGRTVAGRTVTLIADGLMLAIVDRSRIAQRLRADERTFRLFVEHTPAAVAMFDREMRYLAVSRRWTADYRLQEREIIGHTHYEIFPEIPERWRKTHRRCLAGAVESCEEDPFERGDGTIDWVRWIIHPWHDEYDAIGGIIMFTEVITERKRLEERLRQSEKMEAVGRLAGGIAHDFNNLIMVIGGSAELIERGLPPGHPIQEKAAEIRRASDRAASLTRQLLAFSRKQVIQPQVADLNRIVSEAQAMLGRLIGEHITIRTHLAPDLGLVKVDPGQICQVIINLAANARDAMPEGGVLTIETRNVPAGDATMDGDHVALVVADTGTGMDGQTQAHLFEPFFTTKETEKGTGLGLSSAYGIVRQNGGVITVESAPGRGSTFTICFPRTEEPLALPAEVPAEGPAHRGPLTILVVEDNPSVRKLARDLLVLEGHRVLEAGDGEEALRLAEQASIGRIDLVLTDVLMPRMRGPEMWEKLRLKGSGARVIFMSGYADRTAAAVLVTGQPFIAKPFSRDTLRRAIREVMGG